MIKSTLPYKVKKIDFEQNTVKITWQNGNVSKLPFHFLRLHCPCASCINELTGEKILDAKKIPLNSCGEYIGNYASSKCDNLRKFIKKHKLG